MKNNLLTSFYMGGEVCSLDVAREARIDEDSALAKRLIIDASKAAEQVVTTLTIGQNEIRNPQQLKALTEAVRQIIYDRLLMKVMDVEDARNLEEVSLYDDEE